VLNDNLDKAISTKTGKTAQIDESLAPFSTKISNQQLLKRLKKELGK